MRLLLKKLTWLTLFSFICSVGFGAVEFDGTNDIITTTRNQITSNFSFSCWINPDDIGGTVGQTIIGYNDTNASGVQFRIRSSKLALLKGGIAGIGSSNTNLFTGTWYHVGVTYDGSGNFVFYLNGVADGSGTNLQTFLTRQYALGIAQSVANDELYNGKITEVAIYDIVLDSSEMALLGKSKIKGMPYQIQPANLVVYYPLDDHPHNDTANSANGLVFKDRSSNTNDGTASGCNAQAEEVLSYPMYLLFPTVTAPAVGGWAYTINGVSSANMSKVNGVLKANIAYINQT